MRIQLLGLVGCGRVARHMIIRLNWVFGGPSDAVPLGPCYFTETRCGSRLSSNVCFAPRPRVKQGQMRSQRQRPKAQSKLAVPGVARARRRRAIGYTAYMYPYPLPTAVSVTAKRQRHESRAAHGVERLRAVVAPRARGGKLGLRQCCCPRMRRRRRRRAHAHAHVATRGARSAAASRLPPSAARKPC